MKILESRNFDKPPNNELLPLYSASRSGKYLPLIRDNNRGVNHLLTLGPNCNYFVIRFIDIFFILCFIGVNLLSFFLIYKLNSSEEGRLYYLVYLVILIYLDISWLACALINPGIAIE